MNCKSFSYILLWTSFDVYLMTVFPEGKVMVFLLVLSDFTKILFVDQDKIICSMYKIRRSYQ